LILICDYGSLDLLILCLRASIVSVHWLHFESLKLLNFDFNANPVPVLNNADLCGSGSATLVTTVFIVLFLLLKIWLVLEVNEAFLWELFVQAGPVVNVHMPKDRVTTQHQVRPTEITQDDPLLLSVTQGIF
jgi:hypothetical protein